MEWLQRVVFFTDANELDRLASDLPDGKRRTAASIAIHLGQHYAGDGKLVVKFFRGADRVLSGHGVRHEQDFLRVQNFLE
jgi:hypothetical protein